MSAFLDWFYAFATTVVEGIWKVVSGIVGGIFQIFNIANYVEQVKLYKGNFNLISVLVYDISNQIIEF